MDEISVKIAIAEPSSIIRSGLALTLKRVQGFHVQTFEISATDMLPGTLKLYKPELLIINPVYWTNPDVHKLKEETGLKLLKIMAIVTGVYDSSVTSAFDDIISLYDSPESLEKKLVSVFQVSQPEENNEETESLSIREKEILSGVVKGRTNKEIASDLFLSTHTVITHRRNIARKLGIHSAAGLTIYAIVNKLVDIKDINPAD